MSNTDFEAMMSDTNTEYPTLPGSEDQKPVKVVFGDDGEAEEFIVDYDEDIDDDDELDNEDDDDGPSVEELKAYSEDNRGGRSAKQRIDTLTYQREEAKRQAAAAQAENAQLRQQNQALMQERTNSATVNLQMADNMRESMKNARTKELDAAKKAMETAYTEGNAQAIAESQAEIARIQAELTQIATAEQAAKQYKQRQPQQPGAQPQQPGAQPQQQPGQAQPQQTAPLPPQTIQWMQENQHWFGRPEYEAETNFAYGLHGRLAAKGLLPGSDAYWSEANKILKAKFPELNKGTNFGVDDKMNRGQRKNAKGSSRPNVAAPSSRSSGKDPRNKKTVTLSSSQAAIAKKLGVTAKQYAEQLMKKDYDL